MDTIQRSIETKTARPTLPGLEMALYLLVGLGGLLLTTTGLGYLFPQMNIWLTLGVGLLNAACLGGSFFFLGALRGKTSLSAVGVTRVAWRWRYLGLGLVIAIVFLPLRGIIGLAVQMLVSGSLDSIFARASLFSGGMMGFSWLNLAISFLSIAVLPPLSEELYFRGLIHSWLQPRMRLVPRVLLSSFLFSLAHFDSLGVMAAALILGIINAAAYERTKSLWLSILIHFVTNAASVLLLFASLAISK